MYTALVLSGYYIPFNCLLQAADDCSVCMYFMLLLSVFYTLMFVLLVCAWNLLLCFQCSTPFTNPKALRAVLVCMYFFLALVCLGCTT